MMLVILNKKYKSEGRWALDVPVIHHWDVTGLLDTILKQFQVLK